jgi:hypothetical protein
MSLVSRLINYRRRYITDGPIADMRPEDKRKIAQMVQRGQAVTDDHLVSMAIAYANFRARVSRALALIFVIFSALEAVAALFSSFGRTFYAFVCVGLLAVSLSWLWQVRLCRRAAQTMAKARADGNNGFAVS